MQLIKSEKIINIMERTLNFVDSRLIDHGKRVAYLIFKILRNDYKEQVHGKNNSVSAQNL